MKPVHPRSLGLCAAAVLGLALGAQGCFGVRADGIAVQRAYVSEAGTFGFSYVAPPWIVASDNGTSVTLEIGAELFGVTFSDSPPTHILTAGPVDLTGGYEDLLEDLDLAGLGTTAGEIPDINLDDYLTGGIDDLTTGGLDTGGSDTGEIPDDVEIPDYLLDVNLQNPRDVAFAELNYLLREQGASLESGVQGFRTRGGLEGVVYEVVMDPGVFVRSFYFPSSEVTVRMGFVSLFDLETADVDAMVRTVYTDLPVVGGVP